MRLGAGALRPSTRASDIPNLAKAATGMIQTLELGASGIRAERSSEKLLRALPLAMLVLFAIACSHNADGKISLGRGGHYYVEGCGYEAFTYAASDAFLGHVYRAAGGSGVLRLLNASAPPTPEPSSTWTPAVGDITYIMPIGTPLPNGAQFGRIIPLAGMPVPTNGHIVELAPWPSAAPSTAPSRGALVLSPQEGDSLAGDFEGFGDRVIEDASTNTPGVKVKIIYHSDGYDATLTKMRTLGCFQ